MKVWRVFEQGTEPTLLGEFVKETPLTYEYHRPGRNEIRRVPKTPNVFLSEIEAWRYIAERADKACIDAEAEASKQDRIAANARGRIAELEKADEA